MMLRNANAVKCNAQTMERRAREIEKSILVARCPRDDEMLMPCNKMLLNYDEMGDKLTDLSSDS